MYTCKTDNKNDDMERLVLEREVLRKIYGPHHKLRIRNMLTQENVYSLK